MILLDTCTLLWLAADPDRLSARARDLIARHADALFVSAITAFELGLKQRRGKLVLPLPATDWYRRALELHGLREVAVDGEIAGRSTTLPTIHADPCDRFLVATAQVRGLTLLTPDRHIAEYPDTPVAW